MQVASNGQNCHNEPPLTFGSHQSKLIERIGKAPCKANLAREEFIRIVTWIDANAPFYGTAFTIPKAPMTGRRGPNWLLRLMCRAKRKHNKGTNETRNIRSQFGPDVDFYSGEILQTETVR